VCVYNTAKQLKTQLLTMHGVVVRVYQKLGSD